MYVEPCCAEHRFVKALNALINFDKELNFLLASSNVKGCSSLTVVDKTVLLTSLSSGSTSKLCVSNAISSCHKKEGPENQLERESSLTDSPREE